MGLYVYSMFDYFVLDWQLFSCWLFYKKIHQGYWNWILGAVMGCFEGIFRNLFLGAVNVTMLTFAINCVVFITAITFHIIVVSFCFLQTHQKLNNWSETRIITLIVLLYWQFVIVSWQFSFSMNVWDKSILKIHILQENGLHYSHTVIDFLSFISYTVYKWSKCGGLLALKS